MCCPISLSSAVVVNHGARDRPLNVPFPAKTPSPEEKGAAKEALEVAFKGLRDSNCLLLGEIFSKYGRYCFEDHYPHCMAMMRASLSSLLLDSLPIQTAGCTLDELKTVFMDHSKFAPLDDFLLTSDMDAVASRIQERDFSQEALFMIGYTLLWYANGLHHTEGFHADNEINQKRFDQIYALTEKTLLLSGTKEAKLELAEFYYNGLHGVELRKDPKNLEAAHAWLDKALELNQTDEFRARVANLKSCDYQSIQDGENSKKWLLEAVSIREKMNSSDQDPFLVANLNSRVAGMYLNERNFDEAEKAILKSLAHAESRRKARDPETDLLVSHENDHQYFGLYDLAYAKIKIMQSDKATALKHINRALDTFKAHAQDSEDLIKGASMLKFMVENV